MATQRVWWVVNLNGDVENGAVIEGDARHFSDGIDEGDLFDTEAEAIAAAKRRSAQMTVDNWCESSYTVYRIEAVAVVSSKIGPPRVRRIAPSQEPA
ncbi:MAG: hypothetical protein IPK85_03350 [Gemmatimonadetes bacterium]|nr:hypothetical protein [Gemmatimonadota bacterium]